MKNYLFLGDTHGDLDFVVRACREAADAKAEIIQVGDWGFIWPIRQWGGKNELRYDKDQLQALSNVLVAWGVTMRFIDGNHDWHPKLAELAPTREATEIAPNVIYQPRGSMYTDEDGTSFVFMGGAPSIDKSFRKDGVTWWAEEEITNVDMEFALAHTRADVLVTHDAHQMPPGFLPKGDPEFKKKGERSLNNVKKLRDSLGVKLHVHGHWHHAYVDGITRGLDCNYGKFESAMYLWSKDV